MKYLFEKIIGNEEVFYKKLYAINSHKTLDKKTIKEKFFNKIQSEVLKINYIKIKYMVLINYLDIIDGLF